MRTAKNRLLRLKRAKLAALRGFEQHPFLRLRCPIFLTPFRIRPGGRSVRNVLSLAIQDLQSEFQKLLPKGWEEDRLQAECGKSFRACAE